VGDHGDPTWEKTAPSHAGTPCRRAAPQPPRCPHHAAHPLCHLPPATKPPQDTAWAWHGARVPQPPPARPDIISEQKPAAAPAAPASTSPATAVPSPRSRTAAAVLPASLGVVFGKYYTLKLSFWFGRLLAPRRLSPPSLGFWFQCKVL